MLRIVTSHSQRLRGALPPSLLELIFVSSVASTSSSIWRSYHVSRPPLHADVKPPSSSELLSMLSAALQHSEQEGKLTDIEAESHNRRLSTLRLALGNNHLHRVRDAFEALKEHSSVDALTMRDLEAISRMLHSHFADCMKIRDAMWGTIDMAIRVAAKGHADGLKACLLLQLRSGNDIAIPVIYDEFAALSQRLSTPPPESVPLSEKIDILDLTTDSTVISEPAERRSANMGDAEVILTVIAAYAIQDRFDDAFDRFLLSPMSVRLTTPRIRAFCEAHLVHDPPLSNKVQTWAQQLVNLRLLSRHSSLHNYVISLANEKHIAPLLKLYSTTILECRQRDGRLAVKSDTTMTSRGNGEHRKRRVILPSEVWSSFIQAFFKCNRPDLAEALWNDVIELGLFPNHYMWTALLDGYGRQHQLEQAASVWNRMLKAGIEPNELLYGAMIHAYFSGRRPQEAFALFEQFRIQIGQTTEGRQSLKNPTMLPLYNIVLHGLCTNVMADQAHKIMKDMMDHGPKPDIVSYNTFLRHYGRIGDTKNLAAVLRALKPANIQPDVHSFTTVLSALYKGGKRDAHTRMIQVMEAMGVQPNVAMYSAIIDFLVRQGGKENFRNASSLLQLMENNSDKESRPNEVTYTGILAALHRDPAMPVQDVKLYTAELFDRMRKNGTQPNRTMYHYLIKACLENPDAQGLQMALGYYHEMEKRGFAMTNRTWTVILSALVRRGDWAIAGELMNDMFKKGHRPDGALATLVQRLRREIVANGGYV